MGAGAEELKKDATTGEAETRPPQRQAPMDRVVKAGYMQDNKKAIHVAVGFKHEHGRRSRAIRDNPHRWASSRSNELPRRRCAECTGHHPEEEGCPNAVAVADWMDPWMLQESVLKCSYMAAVGEPTCDGIGHLRRHHVRKSAKATGKGQGKPKGALTKGEKKGKGKCSPPAARFLRDPRDAGTGQQGATEMPVCRLLGGTRTAQPAKSRRRR